MKYQEMTKSLRISVEPEYVDDQFTNDGHRYLWRYDISIENLGDNNVQLINRHWDITDALGFTETVDGPGVVGEQPTIAGGTRYSYRSFCPLTTPSGFMGGYYEFLDLDTRITFRAEIPTFSLDSPQARPTLN